MQTPSSSPRLLTRRRLLAGGLGGVALVATLAGTTLGTTTLGATALADTTTTSTSTSSSTSTSTSSSSTSSSATSTTSTVSAPPVPHDGRYFSQTGYRIDNDTIWDYFNRRGGLPTFGYPVSRTVTLQGFTVQFFQRRIVQLDQAGRARLLNTLDPGLLPYASFNGSNFPLPSKAITDQAPDPTDQPAVLAFVKAHAPDSFNGQPVNFYQTFLASVTAATAFPNGGDANLLPGLDLELWGIPTSLPTADPTNNNFIYLRFQRGIMHYDATKQVTEGILLADYLKAIMTGQHLPPDLNQEAQGSPFYMQYDPTQPKFVHNPSLLPNTDLTDAFEPG